MTGTPRWRQVYDALDRGVAPWTEALVRTRQFVHVSAWATSAQRLVRHQLSRGSAGVWHLVNLPAATDVQRLRVQVGALDREVRRLSFQLPPHADQADQKVSADGRASEPRHRVGQSPPPGRTQRPAGP